MLIGRLFFSNVVNVAIAPAEARDVPFLARYVAGGQRPFHAFFYATAVAQGLEEHFDDILGVLRAWFASNTDAENNDQPFAVEEVVHHLLDGEEAPLQGLANQVNAV